MYLDVVHRLAFTILTLASFLGHRSTFLFLPFDIGVIIVLREIFSDCLADSLGHRYTLSLRLFDIGVIIVGLDTFPDCAWLGRPSVSLEAVSESKV